MATKSTSITESLTRFIDNRSKAGFENLGSDDDTIFDFTTTVSRRINAQGGQDEINLGSGDDVVYGGTGDDTIRVGSGNNTVYAGFDNDYVMANKGADVLYGGQGNDELWGDQDASHSNATGHDKLFGGAGRDKLIGHSGADELTGGTGADTFVYHVFNESTDTMRDKILDFSRSQGDKIDLSFMDANGSLSGSPAFDFETGFTGDAGSVWAEGSGRNWTVFVDQNGGGADMVIDVTLTGTMTSLQEGDFIL